MVITCPTCKGFQKTYEKGRFLFWSWKIEIPCGRCIGSGKIYYDLDEPLLAELGVDERREALISETISPEPIPDAELNAVAVAPSVSAAFAWFPGLWGGGMR
jgi:hypothetical protein